jgi:hypothetical protein
VEDESEEVCFLQDGKLRASIPLSHFDVCCGEPAVKPLKIITMALLGLLLVMLGALSLYQGIAEEAPLWLPWVRGSLAIVSGLVLVVLSLNRSRRTQAFMRQPISSWLSRGTTVDCAAGVSGETAAEMKNIGAEEDRTGE